jgi:hypothetical protein
LDAKIDHKSVNLLVIGHAPARKFYLLKGQVTFLEVPVTNVRFALEVEIEIFNGADLRAQRALQQMF